MSVHMAETIKEERLRWAFPIVRKEARLVDVAAVCPHGKRSIERWVAAYKRGGEAALEPQSTRPKTNPKETEISIKERVITLRKKTKLCALKLHWRLEKQGVHIHERTVGKILKTEGLVRKYRVKKITYKYLRAVRKPGELFEMDVKHVPGRIAGKRYFQYTAIDTASRWRYLRTFEEESTYHTCVFLLDVIDRGKPAQNGTVERSHREDQEKFYEQNTFSSFKDLNRKLRRWNIKYNDLEHCGLNGKTPNEVLALFA